MVTVHKQKAPREIFGNPLLHAAHRADVVRLVSLLSLGGIYLDADVFVHRPFDQLLANPAVLGEERVEGAIVGLCNAVILAETGAPFIEKWRAEYKWFRSKGHDEYWDEHSVKVPYGLAQRFPSEITVLPYSAFFWPTFRTSDLALIFESPQGLDLSAAYATHLWESPAWSRYLEHLTPSRVRAVQSNFHDWARPMMEGLPDSYGAPTATDRVAREIRALARRARYLAHRIGAR
jgi:hypothetical protein